MATSDPRELSIGELLARFADQSSRLFRQELELARVELLEGLKALGASSGLFAACTLFALGAWATLTVTVIAALAMELPLWAASLIVSILYAAVAAACFFAGRKRLGKADLVPHQTLDTVQEDAQWVATRARSARK